MRRSGRTMYGYCATAQAPSTRNHRRPGDDGRQPVEAQAQRRTSEQRPSTTAMAMAATARGSSRRSLKFGGVPYRHRDRQRRRRAQEQAAGESAAPEVLPQLADRPQQHVGRRQKCRDRQRDEAADDRERPQPGLEDARLRRVRDRGDRPRRRQPRSPSRTASRCSQPRTRGRSRAARPPRRCRNAGRRRRRRGTRCRAVPPRAAGRGS